MRAMSKKMADFPSEWLGGVWGWVLWHCLRSKCSVAANCRQSWGCMHVILVLEGNLLCEKEGCFRNITSNTFTYYVTKGTGAVDLYGPWKGPEIPFTVSGNVIHVTYFGLSLFEGPIGVRSHYHLSARSRRQLQSPESCGFFAWGDWQWPEYQLRVLQYRLSELVTVERQKNLLLPRHTVLTKAISP
jgi:hypothetical protein